MQAVTAQFLRIFWWQIARTAARHRLLAVCNVLSIALGIAVYLAIQIANASATRAFARSVDLVAGRAHLEIRGDIDETLWPEIEHQPGVEAVTGVVDALATLPGKPGEYLRLSGIDIITAERFRVFEMTGGSASYDAARWLSAPGGVAITHEFAALNGL
jgi:putative ABC transport system permease protein